MKVTGTDAAARIVDKAKRDRRGELVFTIGTGCCESTAPFLYEDFWPGPDSEAVGDVAGVLVYAPEYLRILYPGDEGVTVDVEEGSMAASMRTGTVWVNDYHMITPTQPFGGYKQSGVGRELGEYGYNEYRQIKHVWQNTATDRSGYLHFAALSGNI